MSSKALNYRPKKVFLTLLGFTLFSIFFYYKALWIPIFIQIRLHGGSGYGLRSEPPPAPLHQPQDNATNSTNYFLDAKKLNEMGWIVNTPGCKIPDLNLWDESIAPFYRNATPAEDCSKKSHNWTSVQNFNELVFDTNKMEKDGHEFNKTFCCFKIIKRVEQELTNYHSDADNLISYSNCTPISNQKTNISEEFIMVECSGKSLTSDQNAVYRAFHSFPVSRSSSKMDLKTKHWNQLLKNDSDAQLPPNILIIGIDSTSRLNFRRNMPKTREVLEELGAVEMMGYTRVGDSTLQNFCAVFNGYSNENMQKICFDAYKNIDNCPWIWKRLDEANYLTAHMEDAPTGAAFNSWGVGFVKQPVDFYLRTLYVATHDYGVPMAVVKNSFNRRPYCIGHQIPDDIIISYVEGVMNAAASKGSPVFSLSWSTTISHDDNNAIQLVDETYQQLLKRLTEKGYMNNTILIFMGDHGYRYGPWRQTLIGYYEDKLPNMWIRFPPWIRQKYPQWQQALERNSRELTSPYTLYWTLDLLLNTFTKTSSTVDSNNSKTQDPIPRKYKQNFFEYRSPKTCEDIGVPEVDCPCYPVQKLNISNPFLANAAFNVINYINQKVEDSEHNECSTDLKVNKIISGAIKTFEGRKKYVVRFSTLPGDLLFEGEIDYYPDKKTFGRKPAFQRVNKINENDIACVQSIDLKLICYCKK